MANGTVPSIEKSRSSFLVARTEIRDEDGALVEVKFSPTAAAAATKAIEVANRMLGYTTPEERESDLSLCVEFGESEALAK